MRYYSLAGESFDLTYGSDALPSPDVASAGFKGFLAEVRVNRYDTTYAADSGPDGACEHLPGPYQWLLPACSSADIEGQLEALGLPEPVVAEVLRSAEGDQDEVAAFSYNETGHTRHAWSDGLQTTVIRDSDGRPVRTTLPNGTETSTAYTVEGWAKGERTVDASGDELGETLRWFDNEGNVTLTCEALQPRGCRLFAPGGGQLRVYRSPHPTRA